MLFLWYLFSSIQETKKQTKQNKFEETKTTNKVVQKKEIPKSKSQHAWKKWRDHDKDNEIPPPSWSKFRNGLGNKIKNHAGLQDYYLE